jgi:MFS family permease
MQKQKIFYGWYVVAAGMVCLWINAGIGFYSFPVFFVELTETFGWGRGETAAGISVSILLSGLASPLIGMLVPKYGSKNVVLAGALIMGGALVLFSFMQTLWQYYLICIVLAVGWTGTGPIPTSYSVSDWFEKKRGRATGIMMVGVGLGGLTFAPLTRRLIDHFQWQTTFIMYGIFVCLILVPVIAAVFKRRPRELGVLPDGELPSEGSDRRPAHEMTSSSSPPDWTFREAVRTRAFWAISVTFILATFGQTAILINQVAYFQDVGISPKEATGALGLCAMLGITGKLFFGAMADRYPARYAMVLCFGLQAVGTVLLLCTPVFDSPYWFVLVWGFAMGGVIALEPLIAAECFGLKSFGVTLGMIYVFTTLGAAIGPPFAGFVFDISNSYVVAFFLFVATYALGAGLSFLAIPPGRPPRER